MSREKLITVSPAFSLFCLIDRFNSLMDGFNGATDIFIVGSPSAH